MWEEFGEFHYGRRDLYVELDASLQVIRSLEEDAPQTIADKRVNSTSTLDGVKLRLEGDAWILFRRSGTEPLLRVYCEAPSAETVETILRAGVGMVEQMASGGVSSRRS
jgi:phosphomannomutase